MMKNKRFLVAGFIVLLALIPAVAFGKEATSINATPQSTSIKAGESVTWTVTATYDDSSTEDVSSFALFAVPTTAGGTLDANTFTSEKPGTFTIPVTVGEFSDTVSLTVVHGNPVSLELTQSDTSIVAGSETVSFTATLVDSIGNEWDATGQMNLTTDDPDATLTSTTYTSTRMGTWTITAQVGDLKASKQVTVTPDTASKIVLNKTESSLDNGKSSTLSATVTDQYGNPITSDITWSSSDSNVATVDSGGKVTAINDGTASITASYNGLLASSIVTVTTPTAKNTNEEPTNENANTNESTINTDEPTEEGMMTPANESENEVNTEESETCKQAQVWVLIVILAVYALILYGYYLLIRREDDKSWWIFPVLLTIIGLIIWNKYLCPGLVVWFPWVLVAVGLAITGYGRGQMRKTNSGRELHIQIPTTEDSPKEEKLEEKSEEKNETNDQSPLF